MQIRIDSCLLKLIQGDITRQEVDAIVNAANSALAGGGGVDGAIHDAGGPSIMWETDEKYPDGCETGHAVITGAGHLLCKFVIHTVGPIWHGGVRREPELLRSAYINSLKLAVEHECQSVAFPAISTGVFGYPMDRAAMESITAVAEFLRDTDAPREVRFVLFDGGAYGAFSRALDELRPIIQNW